MGWGLRAPRLIRDPTGRGLRTVFRVVCRRWLGRLPCSTRTTRRPIVRGSHSLSSSTVQSRSPSSGKTSATACGILVTTPRRSSRRRLRGVLVPPPFHVEYRASCAEREFRLDRKRGGLVGARVGPREAPALTTRERASAGRRSRLRRRCDDGCRRSNRPAGLCRRADEHVLEELAGTPSGASVDVPRPSFLQSKARPPEDFRVELLRVVDDDDDRRSAR